MSKLGIGYKRFWRPLIGVAVAYAIAAQSLLITIGGFAPPALADAGAPAFELCLHAGQGTAQVPADNSDHAGCTHCIFCFAGAHHAMVSSPASVAHRTHVHIVAVSWVSGARYLSRPPAYAIANPRGPPPGV